MIEITLTVVILGLLALLGWQDYGNRKERKSLLNALRSKDATDFANLELADKTKIKVDTAKEKDDLIPVSELNDDEFQKRIVKPANA